MVAGKGSVVSFPSRQEGVLLASDCSFSGGGREARRLRPFLQVAGWAGYF